MEGKDKAIAHLMNELGLTLKQIIKELVSMNIEAIRVLCSF